ncbi:Rho termination factor N-terminal domain-containing protein, partial [Cellulomonas carbonis]
MTETIEVVGSGAGASAARSGALSALRLPELQALAAELGLRGTSGMRKSDLVSAIRERRAGGTSSAAPRDEAPARE